MSDQEQETPSPEVSPHDLEKIEEAKLKAKYGAPGAGGPNAGRLMGGHSAFLQKRLAKGQKFFDSGDYQMAKQKCGINKAPLKTPCPAPGFATGEAIPTPETVPARKTSIIQPSKFTSNVS